MSMSNISRLPSVLLSSVLLALVACPIWFVAFGALGQYSPMFSALMAPPFVCGAAYLLWRYLARDGEQRQSMSWLELPSWIMVGAFAFFVSGIGLVTPFEHAGALAVAVLATAARWIPVRLLRRTRLERRVASLPTASAAVVAAMLILGMGVIAVVYLRAPAHFIGGPRGQPRPIG